MSEENNVFDIPTIPKNYNASKVENNPSASESLDQQTVVTNSPLPPLDAVAAETPVVEAAVVETPTEVIPEAPIESNPNNIELTDLMSSDILNHTSSIDSLPTNENGEITPFINEPLPEPVPDSTLNAGVTQPFVATDPTLVEQPAPVETPVDPAPESTTQSTTPEQNVEPQTEPSQVQEGITLSSGVLPETLDQNFGVIGENETPTEEPKSGKKKKEKKPKAPKLPKELKAKEQLVSTPEANTVPNEAPKKPKKSKIGVVIAIIVFLGIFGLVGFFGYRYYYSINPVEAFSLYIRNVGAEANKFLLDNDTIKLLNENNDILELNGELEITGEEESKKITIDGTINKELNRASFMFNETKNETEIKSAITVLDNSVFINLEEGGFTYLMTDTNEAKLADILLYINLKDLSNNLADVIEKDIKKSDFKTKPMSLNIDGKKKIVSKETLSLSKDTLADILKQTFKKYDNTSLKTLFEGFDYSNLSDINISLYISLDKLEKIEITYNNHNISITPVSNTNSKIKYDDNDIDCIINDNVLEIVNNNAKTNVKEEIVVIIEEDKEKEFPLLSITVSRIANDIETNYVYTQDIKINKDKVISMPMFIIDYDSEEGKAGFEKAYEKRFEDSEFMLSLIKK